MRYLELLVAAAVGAFAFIALSPAPEPIVYRDVIVPAARIIEREPPARPPTIIERVRFVQSAPRLIATAPQGALEDVAAFCRPTVIATTDTLEVPAPVLLLRSGTHYPASLWKPFTRDGLTLTGPTFHGDLLELTYSVRNGFDFRVDGDSVLVRYPRSAFVGDAVDLAGRLSLLAHVLEALGVL